MPALNHSIMPDSETSWTVAHQVLLSMGFSRQEYWSGLPCPSPGDLPTSGCEPGSPTLKADSLLPEPPVKAPYKYLHLYKLVRLILLTTRRKIRGTERSVLALAEQHGNTGAILV